MDVLAAIGAAALALLILGLWFWMDSGFALPGGRQPSTEEIERAVTDKAAAIGWVRTDGSWLAEHLTGTRFDYRGRHELTHVVTGEHRGRRAWMFLHSSSDGERISTPVRAVAALTLARPLPPIFIDASGNGYDAAHRRHALSSLPPLVEVMPLAAGVRVYATDPAYAASIQGPVLRVMAGAPGVSWAIDGNLMLILMRGAHWIDEPDRAVTLLDALDRLVVG